MTSHRVWEKISESMQLVASSHSGLKSRISSWAKNIGFRANYTKQSGYVESRVQRSLVY